MRDYSGTGSDRARRHRETVWIRRRHGAIRYGSRWLTSAEMIRLLEKLSAERRHRLGRGDDA
ncbi:hypothetical protein LQ953_03290 [Sphingomonas sp. IC-56]|uniref:hypothetical protein n=1 Tax=Sphingomonas sp. IC-56 TaxID=2898529 RepID=UPI001E3F44ED|nr:hypothetical protein [Sphingomonas sp. IC-56]MCD2323037.1 hypothetical protein [Sphingomonas sp. IC-56]